MCSRHEQLPRVIGVGLQSAKQAINNKSQGSVSTYLKCGGVAQIEKGLSYC